VFVVMGVYVVPPPRSSSPHRLGASAPRPRAGL